MEAVSILDSKRDLNWEYDGEGDVLYISVSSPRPAVGIDIGEGLIVRYDESRGEVVGVLLWASERRRCRNSQTFHMTAPKINKNTLELLIRSLGERTSW